MASFFRTLPRDALRVPADQVVRTDHKNLVNVQELYLALDALTLTYDCWGISLLEISERRNIFARDEIAVAIICREVCVNISMSLNRANRWLDAERSELYTPCHWNSSCQYLMRNGYPNC
jgi:hypothetical protein